MNETIVQFDANAALRRYWSQYADSRVGYVDASGSRIGLVVNYRLTSDDLILTIRSGATFRDRSERNVELID